MKKRIIIREDFEFYKTPDGKINVDKVITKSASGKAFRGLEKGSNISTKRIPFSQLSDEEKNLARSAYKTLKKNGSIDDVDKKFKINPRPDVVMKGDGIHADIYYDDNEDGKSNEKDVRLVASKRRTSHQKLRGLKEESINDIDLEKFASHIEDAFDLAEGNLPKSNLVFNCLDTIFEDFLEKAWFEDNSLPNISPNVLNKIKFLKKLLKGEIEHRDYFSFGDLYDQIYDKLF